MDKQETLLRGEARKLEITPKTADQVRSAIVQSAFVPDATPEMVKGVSRIENAGWDRHEAFLAETTTGLDVVVNKLPEGHAGQSKWFFPNDRGFYLEGFFEEKYRKITTPEGVFQVRVFTGPDRFNQTMATMGRQPGVDSFRLVPVEVGKFTAKFYAESAARLEIPVARHTQEHVEHDLNLSDHIQGWWSMPTEVALHLQNRAKEAVASGDEARLVEFSDGLDKLADFSHDIVPVFSDLLDNDWNAADTIDERIEHAMDFIKNFADPLGDKNSNMRALSINAASVGLIETGLINPVPIETDREKVMWSTDSKGNVDKNSSELLQAKREMTMLAGAYARNIVNMFSLASDRQGITEKADPRRGQLVERLMTRLEPDAVAAFINQNQSPN